ncbi:MAG: UDP-N-acetylmuramate dehydrogenase [Lachnospiraceae bacterium]|jgi:UDP-N-acetylmuramate dehydrogenase|nr:UDP-N-acetylmuramate dehydrogenase [Lachnospiraceae bacterium]
MNNEIIEDLEKIIDKSKIKINEPMKLHTTFQVGGPASFFISPTANEEVRNLVSFLKDEKIPFYIIGNGSNLLVSDKGYDGVIIEIGEAFSEITLKEDGVIFAGAGASLKDISEFACENNLAGFEFASGIPGSLGGATVMNAGAYDGEMKDVLDSVLVLDDKNEIRWISHDNLELGYRTSVISKNGYVSLGARLKLLNGDKESIRKHIDELTDKRRSKQPLEYPSAGSTFKRPVGHFAGKLIQESGMQGETFGGAMVSTKHAGFVINYNNATASDVYNLIIKVKKKVLETSGVNIEPEVKMLGEFN